MRAIIIRKLGGTVEYMKIGGAGYWSADLAKARVYSQIGHAKTSLRQSLRQEFRDRGKLPAYKYLIQPVDVVPVLSGAAEEFIP